MQSGAACLPIITTAARCCVLTCAAATSQLRASIFVGASTAVGAALGTTSALTSGDARRRSMHSFMVAAVVVMTSWTLAIATGGSKVGWCRAGVSAQEIVGARDKYRIYCGRVG